MKDLENKILAHMQKEKFASYGTLIMMHKFINDKMPDIRKALDNLVISDDIRLVNGVYEIANINRGRN